MPSATSVEDAARPERLGRRSVRARRGPAASVLVAVALSCSLALGGLAYAWLSSKASAAAAATTSGLNAVTVTALSGGDTPSGQLQPGGTADVVLRVTNPNTYPVTLISASANGAVSSAGGVGSCAVAGVAFITQSGLSVAIAAGGTTLVDLPAAASMTASSSTGCQGATFTIPVTITVRET
jgi:hypothetical protein